MSVQELVIGVDGGGSKTLAWLAEAEYTLGAKPIGVGESGPSNPQSVGWETALANIDKAVNAAFAAAGLTSVPIAAACVAIAGGDRDDARQRLNKWAEARNLARRFLPAHDAAPLLAAGTPDGVGIAIVSGTGSFAFGQSQAGRTARAGGWGYLFGDEGSGYAIAITALRAVSMAADGRREATQLTQRFLDQFHLTAAAELVGTVYARRDDRQWLASLADTVFLAAVDGDSMACKIVEDAAADLADLVAAVALELQLDEAPFPLALGGGVLNHSTLLRERLIDRLHNALLDPTPITPVAQPIAGTLILAENLRE